MTNISTRQLQAVAYASTATVEDIKAQIDSILATITDLETGAEDLGAALDDRTNGIEITWLFVATALVMLMQLGFALVESGSVRHKSYHHIFLKNLCDFSCSLTLWFFFGYWVAFPDLECNPLDFNNFETLWNGGDAAGFAFQAVFASTTATIVSGAMAERTKMEAYLCFVFLSTGMLYSVIVRWTWGGGFLSTLEPMAYHDFAGSGVVHLTGGVGAFVGAQIVGARAGLWNPDEIRSEIDVYTKHSYDSVCMGTIILWFGWLGFNSGSTTSMVDAAADTAAVAMVNTLICPGMAGISSLTLTFTLHSLSKLPHEEAPARFDLGYTCNAVLGGLVGITAGCDSTPPEWSCIVGIISAWIVFLWAKFCRRLWIDDPVDASSVHGACGVWGLLSIGIFHRHTGVITQGQHELFVAQLIGAGAIVGYISSTAWVYFWVVHCYGLLRLDLFIEVSGIDWVEMKEGRHWQEASELELMAVENYRAYLKKRMAGDMWGKNLAEVLFKFSRMHRSVTCTTLTIAILYNYIFYLVLEWQGFEFFAVVNLAVGSQSAAGAHAEFNLIPEQPFIKKIGLYVVSVSWTLACTNFILADREAVGNKLPLVEQGGLLLRSWAKTASLSLAWSAWLHLRLHPIDWDDVCYAINVRGSKFPYVYARVLMGWARAESRLEYIVGLISCGRVQHITESTLTFASATSDMWVGLDEFMNQDPAMGVLMIVFSTMQLVTVINKLVNPTGLRTIFLMKVLTALSCLVEIPLMVLIIIVSESPLKWVSVAMSWGSCIIMCTVLCVIMYAAKVKARLVSKPPDCPDPLMIDIPHDFVNKKKKLAGAPPEPEKAPAQPVVESEAPPAPEAAPPAAAPTAGPFGFGNTDMIAPVRLQVLKWEEMPITPRGAEPVTPRADGTTPRTGILTVTQTLGEVVRGDVGVLAALSAETPRKMSEAPAK